MSRVAVCLRRSYVAVHNSRRRRTRTRRQSAALNTRTGSVMLPNFEALFGIQHHHRLILLRSRGRGGLIQGVYWTHEEVDPSGSVIARYESYDEVNSNGETQCGWRKYDSLGNLVDEQTFAESWSFRAEASQSAA